MSFDTDDWQLGFENTREGELYREKKKLQQEKKDAEYHRRNEEWEREQADFRAEERRRIERENQTERQIHLHDLIRARDEDIKHLVLRIKFGIEEMNE